MTVVEAGAETCGIVEIENPAAFTAVLDAEKVEIIFCVGAYVGNDAWIVRDNTVRVEIGAARNVYRLQKPIVRLRRYRSGSNI